MLCDLDFSYAYIDDILIASSSEEEHLRHLQILFERLQSYSVVVNPAKCVFGRTDIEFLGYLVSGEGSRPTPARVQAIQEYPRPRTAKELRRYLGMLNFYRRFLPRAAEVQAPLNDLLHDNVKGRTVVTWTPQAERAFESSKKELAQAVLLVHPRVDAELAVFADASDCSVGATLQQRGKDGWEPLAFF